MRARDLENSSAERQTELTPWPWPRERRRKPRSQKCRPEQRSVNDRVIISHLPLVKSIAKKYFWKNEGHVELDDLIGAGTEGLLMAAKRFVPSRGFAFSTYAVWWIRKHITSFIRQERWVMRIPDHIYKQILKLMRTSNTLVKEMGRPATERELAQRLDIPIEKVRDLMNWVAGETVSLDIPVGEDGTSTLGDLVREDQQLWWNPEARGGVSGQDITRQLSVQEELSRVLNSLPDRQQRTVRLRFGLGLDGVASVESGPWSLEELAKYFGISKEAVRKIEYRALKRIENSISIPRQYRSGSVDSGERPERN